MWERGRVSVREWEGECVREGGCVCERGRKIETSSRNPKYSCLTAGALAMINWLANIPL